MKKWYTHTNYFSPSLTHQVPTSGPTAAATCYQFLVHSFRTSVNLQKYTYVCISPSDLQVGVLPIPLYGHCSFYCSRPAVTKQMTHLSC